MECISQRIPYRQTGYFNSIVLDYLDHNDSLKQFYHHPATLQGIQKAIESRKKFDTDRVALVNELKKQYTEVNIPDTVGKNIDALLSVNTFTITTAHQPNIFTGPLYFIYKILHVIRLTEHLNASLPSFKFVPVYYMGSEDADLDELGHTYVDGQKITWKTTQSGAVGRMKVDKEFLKLLTLIDGQLGILPFGSEILSLIKDCYKEDISIQDATFKLVNALFGDYGLIVFIPDNAELKKQMIQVFEDDLLNETASTLVEQTSKQLEALYKVQANPRRINLFYLKGSIRQRIIKKAEKYEVQETDISFTEDQLKNELQNHPECFSPNVILRGLYQATVLPDLLFIGGGGEIAYWLELKGLFEHYKVPYPVLLLRNSFLFVEKRWHEKIGKLGFTIEDFFQPEEALLNRLVARQSDKKLKLNGTLSQTQDLYDVIKKQAGSVDTTLEKHVEFLKAKTIQRLQELEKKMLRAEKRKFVDQQRQISTIRQKLFPDNWLQERHDNFMSYYGKWGKAYIQTLYDQSLTLEQEFVIVTEK